MINIKKIILGTILLSSFVWINAKADVKPGDSYEIKSVSEIKNLSESNRSNFLTRYNMLLNDSISSDKNLSQEVINKLNEMQDYKVIVPKTDYNYEVALAHSDGNFTFVDTADTLEEAKEKIGSINLPMSDNTVIPSVIGKSGQVVYATNSMGRIWKHINKEPDPTINNNTYVYSTFEKVGKPYSEFTYVNHGYVDDVPIIEDRGTAAKVLVSGYEGWVNKDSSKNEYDLIVIPLNQVKDPSTYFVRDGYLYHYITGNMTANYISGSSLRIGKAPSYLTPGKDYYSYDGVYFYEGNTIEEGLNKLINDLKNNVRSNAVNKDKPYYAYFKYLPFRTRTNYTAAELDRFINNNTSPQSKLRGLGSVFIETQNAYGVNALLALGVAMNESAKGDSYYAQYKNNLFGIGAVDFAPDGAYEFATPGDSVREFAKNLISAGYSNPDDFRYYGGYLGNKALGANVKYASDPFWAEKAVTHIFSIETYLSDYNLNNLSDYDGYQLAMYKGANSVVGKGGNLLYNVNSMVSGYGAYAGNVVALTFEEKINNKYEIFPEVNDPIRGNGTTGFKGIYNWNARAYINSDNVMLINDRKSAFIPGYNIEDINKDDLVDIKDISELALKYNKKKGESLFVNRLDLNEDGLIDIFDIVICAKKIK
jgi:beta-N-acetylglucosaminidase